MFSIQIHTTCAYVVGGVCEARPPQGPEPVGVVVVVDVVVVLVVVLVVLLVLVLVVGGGGGGGAAAVTCDVGSDVAYVEPFLFEATTANRSVEPRSADATT